MKYEARRRLELCVGLLPVDRVPVIDIDLILAGFVAFLVKRNAPREE